MIAQNGKYESLKKDPKFRELNDLLQKEISRKHSTPLRTFNLNSKNLNEKSEYFDKLVSELKTMMKKKEFEKKLNENTDPEVETLSFPQRNVQTLIRPQLTNPKIFWSKSEDEDFSSDTKYKNVRNTVMEEKVITNVFKPIRSEISHSVKTVGGGSRKKDEPMLKSGKSIHESLRIQKVKRRTSLPYFWEENPKQDGGQTYDVSYYSSTMKKMSQESSTDYYSSSRKNLPDQMKAASDECIYGEKQTKKGNYLEAKQYGRSRPDRISVTEPSSPLASDYSLEVNQKTGCFDSEMDSESTGSDAVASEMKKSKSFVSDKNPYNYFRVKQRTKKSNTLEIRKPSISSGSSCDSAYKTHSLRKNPKSRRKFEAKEGFGFDNYSSRNQSYSFQGKAHAHEEMNYRRVVKKERSQSWNREPKQEESCQKINPDVFQHLLDVLMQKNRTEIIDENRKELFTKSLPRNSSRRSKDGRRDSLKILKPEESWGNSSQYKSIVRNCENGSTTLINSDSRQRKRMEELERSLRGQWFSETGTRQLIEKGMETLPKKKNSRGKNPEEERVFRIEDKKLWIEICKAVEKVDGKGKKVKKCT